jgi:hypothetical protein
MTLSPKIKAHSIEEVEGALLLLAYLIERDGDEYLPLYERIEKHLAELQRREATKDRAHRLLHSYSRSGQGNEIRSKNFSLSSKVGPLPYLGLPDR